MSTDDWRAVDWPKRQIERLDEELAGTDRAVDSHNQRIMRLENLLTERVTRLEAALDGYGIPRVTTVEVEKSRVVENPFGFHSPVIETEPEFSPPIGGLPAQEMERLGKATGRKYEPDLDDQLDGIPDVHGRQWQDGAPVGGVVPSEHARAIKPEVMKRVTGIQVLAREQYERGLSAGASKAFDNAERRVRHYLTERGFSEETVEELTACVRGIEDKIPQFGAPWAADEENGR